MICIGCGTKHLSEIDCPTCYARLSRCLNVFGHWPMETSMTPAALAHVEAAIRNRLNAMVNEHRHVVPEGPIRAELVLCASNIRSYLQHVAAGLRAFKPEPTDEELLS